MTLKNEVKIRKEKKRPSAIRVWHRNYSSLCKNDRLPVGLYGGGFWKTSLRKAYTALTVSIATRLERLKEEFVVTDDIVTSALAVPVIRTVPGRSTGTGGAVTKTGSTGPGAIRRRGPLVVWVRVWVRFLDVGQLPIAGSCPSENQDPTRTDNM